MHEATHVQVKVLFRKALAAESLLSETIANRLDLTAAEADDDVDAGDDVPLLLAISDNGTEMKAKETRKFMALCSIAQHFGRPGTPADQAWIESLCWPSVTGAAVVFFSVQVGLTVTMFGTWPLAMFAPSTVTPAALAWPLLVPGSGMTLPPIGPVSVVSDPASWPAWEALLAESLRPVDASTTRATPSRTLAPIANGHPHERFFGIGVVAFLPAVGRTVELCGVWIRRTLTESDVQATFRAKLGGEVEPYVILGVCEPDLASRALDVDRRIGLLLPCNVVVRVADRRTIVNVFDPAVIAAVPGLPQLQPIADAAGARIDAALDSLRASVS